MTEFKTPEPLRSRSFLKVENEECNSPRFIIPPSPCMKQLGYGSGVNVYLMERFSPRHGCYKSPWAVKKINRRVQFGEFGQRLNFEADILKKLNHPNIIGYRSYAKGKDGTPCLFMESGEKSLLGLIEDRAEKDLGPFQPKQILKIAQEVAAALHYLHDEKKLLHGDLKSANILVKGDFKMIKLCDFGVAVKLNDKGEACASECYIGTECWSAPEALIGGKITTKSDIFAFGLVLWEMLALNAPHIDKLNYEDPNGESETEDIEAMENLRAKCDEEFQNSLGTRPLLPNVKLGDEYLPVLEIFYASTETDPSLRPSAKQVMNVLKTLEDIEAEVKREKCKSDVQDGQL